MSNISNDERGRWVTQEDGARLLVQPSPEEIIRTTEAARPFLEAEANRARYPTAEESAVLAARLVVLPKLTANELTDEQVEQFTGLFPDWTADGVDVKVGEVYRYDGTLVEVVQGHKPQADWFPSKATASLWKIHRTAAVAPWVQPTGAHDAYKLGAQVTHKGQTWTNTGSDANVWEPGVFGWTVVK